MKKREYEYIEKSIYRKNIIMFIQTLEEVLFPNLPKLLYIGFKLNPQSPYRISI